MTGIKKIVVLGATSALAQAVARIYAERGAEFYLVARDREKLDAVAKDLQVRGALRVEVESADLLEFAQAGDWVNRARTTLGRIDLAFLAHGITGERGVPERDFSAAEQVILTNFTSPVSILTALAPVFEAQRDGTVAVISSVAGDRGRLANYVYGSSKAALNVYLQGYRIRLYRAGARVVTIKPGQIETPMTVGFKKTLIWSTPERIAPGMVRAIDRGQTEIYLPGYWRCIMRIIALIPETLFRRMSI